MPQLRLDVAESFIDSLPDKPYATDDFACGVKIQKKQNAINKRYLSLNHKYITQWITFDIDREGAVADFRYDTVGIPAPNLIVENPKNGHAHMLYRLSTPVFRGDKTSPRPIAYLNAIYGEMSGILRADTAYAGLISKNPMHDSWRTHVMQIEPYTLSDLARHLDLEPSAKKGAITHAEIAVHEGRNNTLFNELREWSYVAVREYRGATYEQWLECCTKQCMALNSVLFSLNMLGYGEVKSIAKSISKFTWKSDAYAYHMFIERQSFRGKQGNSSHGGKARSATYEPLREKALQMVEDGMKKKDIALELGVSDRTIRNWVND